MFTIQAAKTDDVPALAELLEKMDRFYGVTEFDPIDERSEQIRSLLFREHPAAFVLLAKNDHRVVGFAAYSFLWPAAGISQSLYLKELYVTAESRRQGLGKQLMVALFEIAKATRCSRVEWTTDRENDEAMAFYRDLGHDENAGKVSYRAVLS